MKYGWLVTSTFAVLLSNSAVAATLSNNLSSTVAGTESISGTNWIAAQFSTDASTYTLSSTTLLLEEMLPGTATLDLYHDAAGQPGTLAGALSSPTSYSSSLALTTFGGNGLFLQASSMYWLVLTSSGGDFEWAWTETATGSGAGFEPNWAATDDAGITWFTGSGEPEIASVSANPAASAVPEPSSFGMLLTGCIAATGLFVRISRAAN